jgi:acetyltransferase-like isoleucine patch superfamily enzyme
VPKIHPTAIVSELATLESGVAIWHWTHVREYATIGRGTSIGQGCYVDHHVSIGPHCKIQNGVNVYHGVRLEGSVFVGPNVTFTNDLHPRAVLGRWDPEVPVQTIVGEHASLGAGAVILPVIIGPCAMVAAGAVVTRHVEPYQLMRGNPARCVGYVCPCGETTLDHDEGVHCLRCAFAFTECDFSLVQPKGEPWRP